MIDEKDATKEEILKELETTAEDLALEEAKAYVAIAVNIEPDMDWAIFGDKLMGVYERAVREVVGAEAANEFIKGVFKRLGN